MAAPTFVQSAQTDWNNTTTTTKTTPSFTVQAGDILVAVMLASSAQSSGTLTATGGALTWTQRQDVNPGFGWARAVLATAVVDTGKSMTVTVTKAGGGSVYYGALVCTLRAASAVGASAGTSVDNAAPTLNLTTTQADSLLVVGNADANGVDGTSRVWRTGAGTFTELVYQRTATQFGGYAGYHANAGVAGTYAVGLSAPTGQQYSIVAVDIQGSVTAAATPQRGVQVATVATMRASLM